MEVDRDAGDDRRRRARVPLLVQSQDPGPGQPHSDGPPGHSADIGARHAGEIQYVFGTLASVPDVTWEPSDKALSDAMTSYWANFAKKGDPNGAGLPVWPNTTRRPPACASRRDDQGCS